ncbi:hypothetical protein A2V68_02715 [candidate division Kazan bacterium RBG_13_50_9]|uniref:GrpB family protein n=1 Tax=candidate division Kazan bacterium RBG_13_50_9 TaxID=1798535 RepID=A0A1F4NSN4_UNCK3|nr:MAG: hypothetical protein A2V68_02715 [candidate division Kazan bacterium RBG_13_50_9]
MIRPIRQNYRENTRLFNKIKCQFICILGGNVVIEHVGSTAIPKMSGKNIIDILIGVPTISEIKKVAQKIDKAGYFRGRHNPSGEYIFFASRNTETGSGDTHIHLTAQNTERYDDFLALKKYLLDRPSVAKKYSDLKRNITKTAGNDRQKYKLLKNDYIDELLKSARKYYEKVSK